MGTHTSAYFFDSIPEHQDIILTIAQTDIDMLKIKNMFPRYFLKFYGDRRRMLDNFLVKSE